nr:HD domain-containing protein [Oceanococcus sp. HetDA_MAG_MS8]
MNVVTETPELEALFADWEKVIGPDFAGYRNHVYRMLNYCLLLHDCNDEDRQKLAIAGVFHDIGIWTASTIDYIDPSAAEASRYLVDSGLEQWQEEICLMITEHHKLSSAEDVRYPLVDVFRRADLVDFSLGLCKCGLSASQIKAVQAALPNAGFHQGLVRKALRWFIRHPLNPAPMFKR